MNFIQRIAYQDFFSGIHDAEPNRISFLVNSNYKTSTFFALNDRDTDPVGVLRISNTRQFVLKEFVVLEYLRKHGNHVIRQSVPEPINIHQLGSRYIASQSYLRAAKLKPPSRLALTRKDSVRDHLAKLKKWLQSLWSIPLGDLSEEKVPGVDIFAELDYCFAKCNQTSENFYKRILSIAKEVNDSNLPLVINHNDLCLENIFFDQGTIKVIDWELSYLTYPIYDWFYFTANYAQRLWSGRDMSTKAVVNSVKRAFFACNWFSEAVKSQTKSIYEGMKLDTSLLPSFYCLGIFDFLYRQFFPKLIDLDCCAPLFSLKDLYLTQ
jgi:thiamine kinase-like enzyme